MMAWSYVGAFLALAWYGIKGAEDSIYLFWALILFIHATGQRIIQEWAARG